MAQDQKSGLRDLESAVQEKLKSKKVAGNRLGALIKKLEQEREQCDKKISALVDDMNNVRKTELLKRGIPKEALALREKIVVLAQKERSDDSTKKEARLAGEEKRALVGRLQRICKHRFLIGFSGYRGSYSYDYDDGYSGQRMCIVCGITEKEKSVANQSDVYDVLAAGEWRYRFYAFEPHGRLGLIRPEYCDKLLEPTDGVLVGSVSRDGFYKVDIWQPFEEVLVRWFGKT